MPLKGSSSQGRGFAVELMHCSFVRSFSVKPIYSCQRENEVIWDTTHQTEERHVGRPIPCRADWVKCLNTFSFVKEGNMSEHLLWLPRLTAVERDNFLVECFQSAEVIPISFHAIFILLIKTGRRGRRRNFSLCSHITNTHWMKAMRLTCIGSSIFAISIV